jgi:hypothetical protein
VTIGRALTGSRRARRGRRAHDVRRRAHAARAGDHDLITAAVDTDLTYRARVLVTGGLADLLATFRPLMRWHSPVLEVDYPVDRDFH